MTDATDGWNPLLHLDARAPTFREVALQLKWCGRLPDPWEVAVAVRELASYAIQAKNPEQWARKALTTDLPQRKRGRKATAHHGDVKELTKMLLPYCDSERDARAAAQKRLSRPWDPAVVRELAGLVRGSAADLDQAFRWVGEFLHLSEDRIRTLYRMPGAERRWMDADGRPIDPYFITLDDLA
jgi:hypothetical protein